ncbi:hypothetical protein GCM10023149_35130 [Mucilaginibacter gynuensis]|uniref:Lumazine-binding protein n=1 Tax=Mucilaginibacter gynuensis TaxID=1302236 RepID=A0ABP8GUF3_9SPHI
MKTLKLIIPAIALMLAVNITKAEDGKQPVEKLTKSYAVNTYIDAITHGKVDGLDQIIDNNTKFNMVQAKKVVSYSKTEMIKHLESLRNIEQTCSTTADVMEEDNDVSVIKVNQYYPGFIRTNYVTIANTGSGWKITNVYSVFK